MGAAPLATATDLPSGDCRDVAPATSNDDYTACAHFMPEFWGLEQDLVTSKKVEPPQGTGFLGNENWYVICHCYIQRVLKNLLSGVSH